PWTGLEQTGKFEFNSEEGWTLLPDGTIFTFDVKNAPNSERYFLSSQTWMTAGSTIVDLHSPSPFGCIPYGDHGQFCYYPPGEIGPAILRPDGTVFATGSYSTAGPGHNAIWTPGPNSSDPGTWAVGPDFPNDDNAGDSFAALLPNGNVLVEGVSGRLYEWDGVNLPPTLVTYGCLINLPSGEMLVTGSLAQLYTSANTTFQRSWPPKIKSFPATVTRGSTYHMPGN